MAEYWNCSDARAKVNQVLKKYDEIVKACQTLASTMDEYVCVNNKWYDENARTVAKWWNQSKSGGTSGQLKWDDKKGLIITNPNSNNNDGEDRIKKTLISAVDIFMSGISDSLDGLTASHPEIKNTFKKELLLANKPRLTSVDQAQTNMKSLGCKTYKNVALNTASSNGMRSNTNQMNKFINQVVANLKNIDSSLEDYCNEILKIVKNTSTTTCWGFDEDTRSYVKTLVSNEKDNVQSRLKGFKTNLNLALSHTEEKTNLQLNTLKNLSFK